MNFNKDKIFYVHIEYFNEDKIFYVHIEDRLI